MKPRADLWNTEPWRSVPRAQWAIVRGFIGSNNPADVERAHAPCSEYHLDYNDLRRVIDAEMAAYEAWRMAQNDDAPSAQTRMKGTHNAV